MREKNCWFCGIGIGTIGKEKLNWLILPRKLGRMHIDNKLKNLFAMTYNPASFFMLLARVLYRRSSRKNCNIYYNEIVDIPKIIRPITKLWDG